MGSHVFRPTTGTSVARVSSLPRATPAGPRAQRRREDPAAEAPKSHEHAIAGADFWRGPPPRARGPVGGAIAPIVPSERRLLQNTCPTRTLTIHLLLDG